jgi:hypothetical protein
MHMQIREWVNKNSAVTTIVAVVMLFAALYYLWKTINPSPPPPITHVFYYDMITGKLFPAPTAEFPPIETPDNSKLANGDPAGVKANVFSCTRCREGEWYIGYLETYLPGAKAAQIRMNEETERMAKMPPPNPDGTIPPGPGGPGGPGMPPMGPSPQDMLAISEGHLVASHEAVDKWFKQESPEGAALVNAAMKKCPDNKYPTQCFPNR